MTTIETAIRAALTQGITLHGQQSLADALNSIPDVGMVECSKEDFDAALAAVDADVALGPEQGSAGAHWRTATLWTHTSGRPAVLAEIGRVLDLGVTLQDKIEHDPEIGNSRRITVVRDKTTHVLVIDEETKYRQAQARYMSRPATNEEIERAA